MIDPKIGIRPTMLTIIALLVLTACENVQDIDSEIINLNVQ